MATQHGGARLPMQTCSRRRWTRLLLQLLILALCLCIVSYTFVTRAAPRALAGIAVYRMRRGGVPDYPSTHAITLQGTLPGTLQGTLPGTLQGTLPGTLQGTLPGNVEIAMRPMFDYSFENGTLAGRAFPMGKDKIRSVMLLPLNQSTSPNAKRPSACRYRGTAAISIRFLVDLGEIHDAKVAPVSVECGFDCSVEVANNGTDVMEITGLGMSQSSILRVPVYDYRGELTKPFDWTVCVPSVHGSPRYPWIDQWLHYYTLKLKVDHVFIYSALEGQTLQVLNNSGVRHGLERASLVNVFSQLAFEPYYHGQTLAMHDCLVLNRHLGTKWVMFQDTDEVLTLPSTFPTPLDYFLQPAHNGVSALTFGNWFYYTNKCLPETSVQESEKGWPWIARMVPYSSPFCGYLCPDWEGRRKYVVRPGHHEKLFIHNPLGGKVSHVNVSSVYVRHFRGVTDSYGIPICVKRVLSTALSVRT